MLNLQEYIAAQFESGPKTEAYIEGTKRPSNAEVIEWIDSLNAPAIEAAVGETGYLDKVKKADLPGPIAQGVDYRGRRFVAIAMWTRSRHSVRVEGAFVLHQRYSCSPDVWVGAGAPTPFVGALDRMAFQCIKELVAENGRTVGLPLDQGYGALGYLGQRSAPKETSTDCRSREGACVGLLDSIITAARALRQNYEVELDSESAKEALKDLSQDEDLQWLLSK